MESKESKSTPSFAELFENSSKVNMQIHTGDKVTGTVIQVGKDSIFVNLGGRQDGVLDAKDFMDADGKVTVKEGDSVDAYVVGSDSDGIKLKTHMGGRDEHVVDAAVEEAFSSKIPIEGKVTAEKKQGDRTVGYAVQIASSEAFCPASQIDGRGIRKEAADYVGKSFTFRITEYSEDGYKLVVSRRQVLEEEAALARQKLLANLKEGDMLDGTVTNIMPYGAFVDLGGVEGMIHVSELSWDRGAKSEDLVKVGDKVQVKVIRYEPGDGKNRERIGLSLKQAQGDPWEKVLADSAFAAGTKHHGKVMRLVDFGAFIQLAPGVEGLAHISQLGADHRIESPSEVLKEGQEVDVTILDLDADRRRIALCVGDPKVKDEKPAALTAEQEHQAVVAAVAGQSLEGEVDRQAPFGLFVKLPNGQTGLLHISQLNLGGGDNALKDRMMYKQYPLHSKIKVVVREVSGDRISLTTPEALESEAEHSGTVNVKDAGDAGFGSLGDVFGGLKL